MLLFFFALVFGGKKASEHELLHDRLIRVNDALLSAFEDLTKSESEIKENEESGEEVDRSVLGPAGHCMDLAKITVNFDDNLTKEYPCLKDFCNSTLRGGMPSGRQLSTWLFVVCREMSTVHILPKSIY